MRPKVFDSTVFPLLQRRTKPNPLARRVKMFFKIPLGFYKILEKTKERYIERAQFTCKTFFKKTKQSTTGRTPF